MVEEMGSANQDMNDVNKESMESMYDGYLSEEIHKGKVVEGEIVGSTDTGWLVNVNYKCEGFLPRSEWTHRVLVDEASEPQKGDKVRVQVVNVGQGEEAQLLVSRWRPEFDERWSRIEKESAENELLSVSGLRKIKGGLIVDCCGIEGFIPISHLAQEGRGVNPGRFVGETFNVKILEKERGKRRLVLSRRELVEREAQSQREAFYSRVSEGDVVEGTVSSITSFGIFVSLGNDMEGLVHISEIAWQRNVKPREQYKRGDTIKVKVLGLDKETNRISLSIRQTLQDPWETVSERWHIGDRTSGTVTNLTDFGAFVEIEPGIEGLIHIGDLSWHRIKHPKEVLRKGQSVEVQVLEVDMDRKRIGLGYKQLNDPWNGVEERFQPRQDIPVKVVRLADFGAFVQLEEGVEGLIHISQLSRQRVEKPGDVLQEGQEIVARILEINPAERRIRLSLSAIEDEKEKKNRDEDRKGRDESRPRRAAESRKSHEPAYQPDDTSVTIGDVLKNMLDA